jgi:hypothetical protein
MINYYMLDIGKDLYKNKEKIILIFIIILVLYLFTYSRIEKRKENYNNDNREMYIPNCNFLNDVDICSNTIGCQVIDDKCYYDWINLQ